MSIPIAPAKKGFLRTLSWAVYLGISWTWCIGMFLPVILVNEFGLAAWFVFAIPNVLGAAAMGWTLAQPGSSERIVRQHRSACAAFSVVTLAFQIFFLLWLVSAGLMPIAFAIVAIATGLIVGLVDRRWLQLDLILAWLVLAVSLTVFAKGLVHPVIGVEHPTEIARVFPSLIELAPICMFGFLLCPYLDLTFHRARQQMPPAAGKWAFGIGFGIVFLAMIVLTLLYAGDFALDKNPSDRFGSYGKTMLVSWVALHISVQVGFTLSAHLRALPPPRKSDGLLWLAAVVVLAIVIIILPKQTGLDLTTASLRMFSGQLVYRLFMSFYGLVFPAYVWICMVPVRGFDAGPTRRAWVVTGISILIAAPLFWMGFIDEKMLWLLPGVSVMLIAKVFVPHSSRGARRD